MAQQSGGMQAAAEESESVMGAGVMAVIAQLAAELAAMTSAERAAQAYVAGLDASNVSLLSSSASPGARPLVAPDLAYFDATASSDRPQLLVVRMGGVSHSPEGTILPRLWMELDWSTFWVWVR